MAAAAGRGPARRGQPLAGATFAQFTDGTANTVLVAEAADAVIWTKPDEVAFDPQHPPKLGGVFEAGSVVGMADGSVRFVRKGVTPKTLASAIQLNDGGLVDLDN